MLQIWYKLLLYIIAIDDNNNIIQYYNHMGRCDAFYSFLGVVCVRVYVSGVVSFILQRKYGSMIYIYIYI
jgi:hypothetical protein